MASEHSVTTNVAEGGRIVIPAAFRHALGIKPGDEVVLTLSEGEVHVSTRALARRRAREYVQSLVPKGVSLVNELIKERRESVDD